MKTLTSALCGSIALAILVAGGNEAQARIDGLTGNTFSLVAKEAQIVTGDANTIYSWGFANAGTGTMQYPGPTLIVNQNDTVTVNLSNTLPVPVSIIFPGQQAVTATCTTASNCADGLLTKEVTPGGSVQYSFVASQPGTYLYQSGTQPSLQKDMGLVGALIVRPAGFDATTPSGTPSAARTAYSQTGTAFDREFMLLLTDMDASLHDKMYSLVRNARQTNTPLNLTSIDTSDFFASLWFINGRNSPDTLVDSGVWWLPNQPYNASPIMHPGDKVLVREISAGRDLHPFHHHGAHMTPIARDARVLESSPGIGPDLTSPDFTIRSIPGQTIDLMLEWTGKNIGWDIYGTDNAHTCSPGADGYDPTSHEWCADHGKPFPVILPNQQDVQFGEYYSGTPFLGQYGILPPGHPGLNEHGGYFHIWHSHNEKEITTNNVFPGGMKTFLIIEAPGLPISD
ncbi:MAG: multicopper oxidase domain-containing protein [Gallionellaceae bacterium]|nr:multicopper oxidase domain-containing protein [Gallionellaceae bacterium]